MLKMALKLYIIPEDIILSEVDILIGKEEFYDDIQDSKTEAKDSN